MIRVFRHSLQVHKFPDIRSIFHDSVRPSFRPTNSRNKFRLAQFSSVPSPDKRDIPALSPLNENADDLARVLFEVLSETKTDKFAIVIRAYSRNTGLKIAKHTAYMPPTTLSAAQQDLLHEADQVIETQSDATRSTSRSYGGLDDPGKGTRHEN